MRFPLRTLTVSTGVALLALLGATSAHAALSLAPIGSFSNPVYVTSDPLDAGRLFVVERGGSIRLVEDGTTSTFLDLTQASPPIMQAGGEEGLLSVAFPADFRTTGRFYVFFTNAAGDLEIDEFTSSGAGPTPLATRRPVLTVPHPGHANHNGGQLKFGPDGYLYAGTGDGGGGGDPGENAQDPEKLLGKILRIDPEAAGTQPYTVPADNPFVGAPGADEIWSLGLRNPWRFSFDAVTGDLVIGDVGQAAWEEIDFQAAASGAGRGVNFGWDCREGRHEFETEGCAGLNLTDPVHEYPNGLSTCAVTGGYVVRDPGLTELAGRYVFADFCEGELRTLTLGSPNAVDHGTLGIDAASISSFGEDACRRVYVVSLSGTVSRLVDETPTDCPTDPGGGDTEPPVFSLNAPGSQILRRAIRVTASTNEDCSASVRALVRSKGGRRLEAGELTEQLSSDQPEGLTARLSSSEAKRARGWISDFPRQTRVVFSGRCRDSASNWSERVVERGKLRRGR